MLWIRPFESGDLDGNLVFLWRVGNITGPLRASFNSHSIRNIYVSEVTIGPGLTQTVPVFAYGAGMAINSAHFYSQTVPVEWQIISPPYRQLSPPAVLTNLVCGVGMWRCVWGEGPIFIGTTWRLSCLLVCDRLREETMKPAATLRNMSGIMYTWASHVTSVLISSHVKRYNST